ncbi:WXG100 family type VII secretion target [Mycobacterium sp. NPDC003449]
MTNMETDAAVLAKEASNFDRIAGELDGVMKHVDSVAGGLVSTWQGESGGAVQQAFLRYQEAAAKQRQELSDISTNIHGSGTQYTATDSDQASAVHQVASSLGLNH